MSLTKIQNELKAPKNQTNSYGKYNYRSCEDILEAVKPLLEPNHATLIISDDVFELGDWKYVEAKCKLIIKGAIVVEDDKMLKLDDEVYITKAQAGIEKAGGMALPQAFGSASSYARKYALNAMFLIDDTKDADATNKHEKVAAKPSVDYIAGIRKLCKESDLEFSAVAEWALAEKKKDINISANAKALSNNWSKVFPEINSWLIKEGK